MTGDHHGQAAGMASLLVKAVDGILGTHKFNASVSFSKEGVSLLRYSAS
jgi:hypothetical protein